MYKTHAILRFSHCPEFFLVGYSTDYQGKDTKFKKKMMWSTVHKFTGHTELEFTFIQKWHLFVLEAFL